MNRSIFNDVIGPVMRGPSSSHTAASVMIGHLAKNLLEEEPVHAIFRFDPSGSLVTTYRGQGSAMGLAGGLLGMQITDPDLMLSEKIASSRGLKIEFLVESYSASHPDTYLTEITGKSGKKIVFTAISTGGGIIRLTHLNGGKIADDFDYINSLMPVKVKRDTLLPYKDLTGAFNWMMAKGDLKRRREAAERNHIEGKFGQGKNGYNLNEIRAGLKSTSESGVACIFFIMNLILYEKGYIFGSILKMVNKMGVNLVERVVQIMILLMPKKVCLHYEFKYLLS
jgi:iron-sulfur-dependent L-serine dehydratase beta subunit